jgi:hypothetical protein
MLNAAPHLTNLSLGGVIMTHTQCYRNRLATTAAGVGFLFVATLPSFAGDVAQEVSIAAQHAGYAADAIIIATVHSHLHHTINCLVGPNGQAFDAQELNPCQGKGNGALPDTTDATKTQMLQDALAKAQAGLASDDLAIAKSDSAAAKALLMKAM